MDQRKRLFSVRIVCRRFARNHEFQLAAGSRLTRSDSLRGRGRSRRILALITLNGRVRGARARRRVWGGCRRLSLLSAGGDAIWWLGSDGPWRVGARRLVVCTEETDGEECDHDAHAHGTQHPRTLRTSTLLKSPDGSHHLLETRLVVGLVREQSLGALRGQRKGVKRHRCIYAFVLCRLRRQQRLGAGRR